MKNIVKVAAVVFVLSLLSLAAVIWWGNREPVRGGDFTLQSSQGEWTLSRHAKKLNLLYIGYAKCPDVCPMTLAYAGAVFKNLTSEQLKDIQLIFLSVDHEHDTPASVHDYAAQFYKDFIGLTGTQEQIDLTVNLVGASYILETDAKSYLGYSISHTDKVYFLNDKGRVLGAETSVRSEEQILNKIKEYL